MTHTLLGLINRDNVTQFTLGSIGTGTSSFLSGADPISTGIAAVVVPGLVLLLINLPKMIRDYLALYRELRNGKDKDSDS